MSIITKLLFLVFLIVLSSSQVAYLSNQGCRSLDSQGHCLQCSFRFYKDLQGICQPVNPLCRTWDQKSGDCLTCYFGYTKIQNTCLLSTIVGDGSFDPNCHKFNMENFACEECSKGYYFNQNKRCQQIDPNCRIFNSDLKKCDACYIGYAPSVIGQCQLIQTINDPYCKMILNGKCSQCFNRFFFNSIGKCQMVNSLCKDYVMNSGICSSCFTGFSLKGNDCVLDRRGSN